jgi:site-specific recombinase XerD
MKHKPYAIDRSKFLTLDQTKLLLKTCEDLASLDLIKGRSTWVVRSMLVGLALRTGLRVSEIANLTHGQIHISAHDSYLTVLRGKGGKRRDVYFNGPLGKQLKEFINVKQKTWRMPVGPDDYLFAHGKKGKQKYSTTGLHLSFKKALRKVGLGHHTIHHARHSFAVLTLRDTNNLRFCQKQLGHSSIAMTSLYADILPEDNARLAGQLSI